MSLMIVNNEPYLIDITLEWVMGMPALLPKLSCLSEIFLLPVWEKLKKLNIKWLNKKFKYVYVQKVIQINTKKVEIKNLANR